MSASVNDKLTDTRNAARPASTTVSSGRSSGGTTLQCASLTGWPTASKVHFVTYKIDSNSNPVAGTQLDCYGIVSSNNIGSFTVVDGTDTGNAVGDIVEMLPTSAWGQGLADWGTQEHSRTGTHTAITTTSINNAGTLTQTGVATFTAVPVLPASTVTFANLLSTIFSGQVQTQANAGTAGGTMSYINLGGVKLLWCLSATNLVSGASANAYTFTLPTSFFSTITYAGSTSYTQGTFGEQYSNVQAATTVTVTARLISPGGAATSGISIFVIGT